MADSIEPLPENEKDPTGEFRKDLHAVEALQRYLGAPSNRPANHARVVAPGQERTELPDETSPYNPTDFLGLNAEIENLLQLASQPVVEEPGQKTSWLLEHDEKRAAQGTQTPRDVPRASALEGSFVEPEGRTERTRRMFVPALAAVALIAVLGAGWMLSTKELPSLERALRAVGLQPGEDTARGPAPDLPEERWALRPDGTWEEAPVGSSDAVATEPVTEPTVGEPDELVVVEEPVEITPANEPAVDESATSDDSRALGDLAATDPAPDALDAVEPQPFAALGPALMHAPFPWPATLASALAQPRSGELSTLVARDTSADGATEPAAEPVVAEPSVTVEPTVAAADPVRDPNAPLVVDADQLARWMLLGAEAKSWSGASVAEIETMGDVAALDEALTDVPTEDASNDVAVSDAPASDDASASDLDDVAGVRSQYSTLRVARGIVADHWWGEDVPEHLIREPRETYTPEVGRVRVRTVDGEVYIGRLAWVGRRLVCLEAEPGTLSLPAREVLEIEPLAQETKPKSLVSTADLGGLPEVRVQVESGYVVGRLLAQDGTRVTLATSEGGRVTVDAKAVEPTRGAQARALIRGRVEE